MRPNNRQHSTAHNLNNQRRHRWQLVIGEWSFEIIIIQAIHLRTQHKTHHKRSAYKHNRAGAQWTEKVCTISASCCFLQRVNGPRARALSAFPRTAPSGSRGERSLRARTLANTQIQTHSLAASEGAAAVAAVTAAGTLERTIAQHKFLLLLIMY